MDPRGLPPPAIEGIYGILDPTVAAAGSPDPGGTLERTLREALAGGTRIVQYRDKEAAPRDALERAVRLAGICREHGALLIVNDRLDVAILSGAGGAHLGQEDLPVAAARRVSPPGFLLGVSAGSAGEARRAEEEGADYVGVGAVFATTTKPDAGEPLGVRLIEEVAAAVALPVVAIGGITRKNVRAVLRAGASAFAVASDLFGGAEVRERAAEFARIWEEERGRPGRKG